MHGLNGVGILSKLILLTIPLCAEAGNSVMSQKAPVAMAATLSAEEIAYAARLSDAERRAFVEKLTPEQRKEMMAQSKHRIREEQEVR